MFKNESNRIALTDERVNAATDKEVSPLGRGRELEKRITPLVVIAIIAILIAYFA